MLMRFLLRIAALGAAALAGSTFDPSPALAAKAYAPSRFTVSVEGSGPDLILIPGLVSSRQVWDRAVAGPGRRYREGLSGNFLRTRRHVKTIR